jgi:hypothetical protein
MGNGESTVPAGENALVPQPAPEESCCVRLSERDAEQVKAAAENPPLPNAAALEAAKRFLQQQG